MILISFIIIDIATDDGGGKAPTRSAVDGWDTSEVRSAVMVLDSIDVACEDDD